MFVSREILGFSAYCVGGRGFSPSIDEVSVAGYTLFCTVMRMILLENAHYFVLGLLIIHNFNGDIAKKRATHGRPFKIYNLLTALRTQHTLASQCEARCKLHLALCRILSSWFHRYPVNCRRQALA